MRDHKVVVGGVGIQVRDHGGRGDAVVFLHYGGGNLMMWEPAVSHLSDTFRCIAFDLRGHGRSDAPPTGYHIDTMALDVIGVLDELGIARVHVVGSSLGAEVGLSLAAGHPERVRSLVCEGAFHSEYGPYGTRKADPADVDAEIAERRLEVRNRPETAHDSVEAFVTATRQMFESWGLWNDAVGDVVAYNALEREDRRVVSAWRRWAKDEYMAQYFGFRFEEYYAKVACPILMLPGEHEANDPRIAETMEGFRRLASQCEIVRLPGAIHPFGWMILPEAMCQVVRGFFAETQ